MSTTRLSGLRRFFHNRLATAGSVVLALVVLLSLVAPLLPLQNPDTVHLALRLKPPGTSGHLLGADQLGRDMLSRLIFGTRVSLAVGIVATLVAAVIGSLIGIVAAFYGRTVDTVLMRGIDMLMAFPYLLLALAIVAVLGPGLLNALFAIAIVNIPFFARNVRGATVSLVRLEYVDTARLSGLSNVQILFGELLPNVLPVIFITISTTVGWMILETAGLSFLGLGAQPPRADLGSMLGQGRNLLLVAPHVATIPGIVILILVIAINLVGDGLRDVIDPQLKSGALLSPAAATAVDRALQRRLSDGGQTENLKRASAKSRGSADREPRGGLPEGERSLTLTGLQTWFWIGGIPHKAVDDVSIHLSPGEALGVMGESGSGKSITALSVLSLVPTPPGKIMSGSVHFGAEQLIGAPLSRLQSLRGDRIAYVFQNPMSSLNPLLRVGEQIEETIVRHQAVTRREARARAEELMEAVRIPDARSRFDSFPHEFSGGMQQRVCIAIALANDPDVIIADEPTTALDVTIQAQILRLLAELQHSRNLSLLMISHDFGVLSAICSRIVVMYAGQIVETGKVDEIFRSPLHPYTRRLMACVPRVGAAGQEMDAIPGIPPAIDSLPTGCHFADRCDMVQPECRQLPIPLESRSDGRSVRCIFAPKPERATANQAVRS